MKPIILSLLLWCSGAQALHAQIVYGRASRNQHSADVMGFNYRTDAFVSSLANMRGCLVDGCTSNLQDTYYFVSRNCNGSTNGESIMHVVKAGGGLVNFHKLSKKIDALEYYDGILWGIEEYTGQLYQIDIDDGTMILYDNVFKDPTWGINAPFIYSTAMNHDKRILYFTCANGADLHSVYFYQYDMLNRTATRAPLPSYTTSFDYAPLNDRAYFVCGASPGQPNGISEYNIATNTLTNVYTATKPMPWDVDVTIDTGKNRLFFMNYSDVLSQCITTELACYRINSRTMDITDVSGRACYMDYMEFLPTDKYDTTGDPFPTGIQQPAMANEVRVYPNPASDALHIEGMQNAQLQFTDMNGRVVMQASMHNGNADVSALPQGLYILKLSSGNAAPVYKRINILR